MATWHTRTRWSNTPTNAEIDAVLNAPNVPNMQHDADDSLYWSIWAAQPKHQLVQMIGADATAEFIATLPARPMARYMRLAERVEIEKAAPTEYTCEDGVFELVPASGDDDEIIF